MRVKLINAMSLPHPHNKKRTILHHAGDVLDMDSAIASRAIDMGAAQRLDEDEDEDSNEPEASDEPEEARVVQTPVEASAATGNGDLPSGSDADAGDLPPRPSNNASAATWSNYLKALGDVTSAELGPLEVPSGTKRDEMIAIGDARVAEWNEAG